MDLFETLAKATRPVSKRELIEHSLYKGKVTNVEFEGIDYKDAPDFCDAYIINADLNGIEMSDDELQVLSEDSDLVYELLIDYLY